MKGWWNIWTSFAFQIIWHAYPWQIYIDVAQMLPSATFVQLKGGAKPEGAENMEETNAYTHQPRNWQSQRKNREEEREREENENILR